MGGEIDARKRDGGDQRCGGRVDASLPGPGKPTRQDKGDLAALTGLSGENPLAATIADLLGDGATSVWMREALASALKRDPIDTANDAEALAQLLLWRAEAILQAKG